MTSTTDHTSHTHPGPTTQSLCFQMMKTKTTPHGGSGSHCPRGMATATFTSSTKADPEQQFEDTPGEETEDSQDWLDYGKEATQGEGEASTSKSKGKTGDQPKQAEGGAKAPPEETPPVPELSNPKPGTSKDPTDAPAKVPTQDPTQTTPQNPDEETPPDLTDYVKSYQQAGKAWLDTVLDQEEQACTTLFDTLQVLGNPHIDNLTDANRQQVFKCIRDRTGRFLREDDFVMYVEKEEAEKKPKYKLTGDAREALKDYYDTVHKLCEAQTNLISSTKVLEEKIEDKSLFLDIIKQVQLPVVQVSIRTVEELEKLEGKTYRELTLLHHLPNFRRIYPNMTEQTRTMAAFIYYILFEQITSLRPSQTGCAAEFRCGTTPFKRLITGKRQPGGPGRSGDTGKSSRKLEEVAEMEGATPSKQRKVPTKSTRRRGKGRGRGKKAK